MAKLTSRGQGGPERLSHLKNLHQLPYTLKKETFAVRKQYSEKLTSANSEDVKFSKKWPISEISSSN